MGKRLSSADLIGRLRGAGYTQKEIGAIVGRSDRMVRKVATGASNPPGMEQALRKAWSNVSNRARHGRRRASVDDLRKVTPAPPRRKTAAGREARLRRGVWQQGPGWATGTIGGQAARAGGGQLLPGVELAARRMWQLSVTVTFRERKKPRPGGAQKGPKWYPPKHAPGAAAAKTKKVKTWNAGARLVPVDVLREHAGRGDGHLAAALLTMLRSEGVIEYADEDAALLDVMSVEIRIWGA